MLRAVFVTLQHRLHHGSQAGKSGRRAKRLKRTGDHHTPWRSARRHFSAERRFSERRVGAVAGLRLARSARARTPASRSYDVPVAFVGLSPSSSDMPRTCRRWRHLFRGRLPRGVRGDYPPAIPSPPRPRMPPPARRAPRECRQSGPGGEPHQEEQCRCRSGSRVRIGTQVPPQAPIKGEDRVSATPRRSAAAAKPNGGRRRDPVFARMS